MVRIELKKGEDRRIREGHPWVFSNEIRAIDGDRLPGISAEVYDASGGFLGIGYYNPRSLIAARILSRRRENIDSTEFFIERIRHALTYRMAVCPGEHALRVVFGEADFLPGLVVDKYDDWLSIQLLTGGMEFRREAILAALTELFRPKGIVARNDVSVRTLEGLEEKVEILSGSIPDTVEITEHGIRLLVDLMGGQKTGHFLDQKSNHLLLKGLCAGKEILDLFCYSGSWALHAAAFGARSVLGIDISEKATMMARQQAVLNNVADRVRFEAVEAFARLRSLRDEGVRFGVVVLDPPAFVKSKKLLNEALKGYITVNRRAMELLDDGGYLVTCSCSYHLGREQFRDLLVSASRQARRPMRLVATGFPSPDHPVMLGVPETDYLKCFVLQAI
jgi:23S rRNA (cytosine1962-C5)-methyltransferase